jgi:exosortase/archaeosortase family protein
MAPRAIVGFAVFFPTFGWLNFGWLNYRTAFANVGREAVESVFQWRFIPHLIVKLPLLQIGTPRFQVEVAPECSGLEGIGLMLAFGVTWIVLFREQCRFPQVFLPLPAGAVLIFLLNSVRITALILIGNAGAERIALGGFHSQAGLRYDIHCKTS